MPRRRSGRDFAAPLIGAALSAGICFEAAGAERIVALAEVGVDHRATHAACGSHGRKDAAACAETRAAPAPKLQRPLFAIVSIADQTVSVYNHDGLVTRSPVSTGMPGHSTPRGVFTIIGRERFHASNLYSGAPMPYMQRLTWSGVAMHVGVVPGHPASHGCIRLPEAFAVKLWGMTRIGERVVVAPGDVTPTEISHPLLPAPKMQVFADAGPAAASASDEAAAAAPRLNPHEYAERLKAKARADKAAAAKIAAEAYLALDAKENGAARITENIDAAKAVVDAAQKRVDAADKALQEAQTAAKASPPDFALARAEDEARGAKAKAEEERAAAAAKLDAAAKVETAGPGEVDEAYKRWQAAAQAFEAAEKAEKDAELRAEPVSILISKADKRVYVRQGLAPVFDAPASVRDPKSPLGSHLYIASAVGDDGSSLKWSVVSLPAQHASASNGRRKEAAEEEIFNPLAYTPISGSAEEALERVEIAPEIREKIAERLWTGASLIISDLPLSGETSNIGTDITVKLR
jgi:L,D-transpeptidase catalytic domain